MVHNYKMRPRALWRYFEDLQMRTLKWKDFIASEPKRGAFLRYSFPKDKRREATQEGQLGLQDAEQDGISGRIFKVRTAQPRPPILEWDVRQWTGYTENEKNTKW